VDGPGFESRRI